MFCYIGRMFNFAFIPRRRHMTQKNIAFRNANVFFFIYSNGPNNVGRPIYGSISYIFFRHVNKTFLSKERLIKKTIAFKRKRDIYARQGSRNVVTGILESGFKKMVAFIFTKCETYRKSLKHRQKKFLCVRDK